MAALFQNRVVRWGLYLAFWTSLGLFNICQSYVHSLAARRPLFWFDIVLAGLTDWYVWAALAPAVVWLARRFRFGQSTWRTSLAFHAPASIVVGFAVSTGVFFFLYEAGVEVYHSYPFAQIFAWIVFGPYLVLYVWIYWAIVFVDHARDYYLKYREREVQASRLAALLARAELDALKMQLHPHFLFNTLQTVSALMHKDVELADEMLARLADLLRATLDTAQAQEVPLRQELDFIETYLEIEQARLGARLRIRFEIEPEARDALVPNLILQPLVENAVRHGIAPRSEGGRIMVRARRVASGLELEVEDDGPGLSATLPGRSREGLGLANTRARLAALYGPGHRLELGAGEHGGLRAQVRLPFREPADETPGAVAAGVS
jgi:sensor histidine kinase YesM